MSKPGMRGRLSSGGSDADAGAVAVPCAASFSSEPTHSAQCWTCASTAAHAAPSSESFPSRARVSCEGQVDMKSCLVSGVVGRDGITTLGIPLGEATLAFGAEHASYALVRRKHRGIRHTQIVGGLADGAAIYGDPPEGLPGPRLDTLFHGVLDLLGLPQQERTPELELLVFLTASRIDDQQALGASAG